jgi:hypothetical protein
MANKELNTEEPMDTEDRTVDDGATKEWYVA